ncbi:ComF family protein [Sphingobacterium humi]|uniref:ComF family protein n=1 Tax=Sphingobacterium humi TaxID=1796905 RepID=A0A6N8L083_9SPHI|nr:double zinc ribbon domain-containing protein [Sphingobacterium humi]MVZ61891.1 ComF family protein [Sphingobacterium humi]
MKLRNTYGKALLHLVYPPQCAGCKDILYFQEHFICSSCLYHLPFTEDHYCLENESYKQLRGKLDIQRVVSMWYFRPATRVSRIIHHIKYANKPHLATYVGRLYAQELRASGVFEDVDLLIPLPLHPWRKLKRGYNQSDYFGRGLSEGLEKPLMRKILARVKHNPSQTNQDRIDRFDNVQEIFKCRKDIDLNHKHILLLDDVLTTGATITSAGQAILACFPHCRISVATIAKA